MALGHALGCEAQLGALVAVPVSAAGSGACGLQPGACVAAPVTSITAGPRSSLAQTGQGVSRDPEKEHPE